MVQHETFLAPPGSQTLAGNPESQVDDRRRPGRPDQVNSILVPLLRGNLPADALVGEDTERGDDRGRLAPAVGIAVALGMSVPLWAVIGFAVRAIWH